METKSPSQYGALSLAYVGDSVYEVYVRTQLIDAHPDMPVQKLHKQAIHFVNAKGQSDSVHAIMDMLNEEELAVFRRGRNAKSHTVPKHAELIDYRHATGFEALIGYLYLKNDTGRLHEVMKAAYEAVRD